MGALTQTFPKYCRDTVRGERPPTVGNNKQTRVAKEQNHRNEDKRTFGVIPLLCVCLYVCTCVWEKESDSKV